MNERTRLTSSDTYVGEDDIIERHCFLPELCRDWCLSSEEILRHDEMAHMEGKQATDLERTTVSLRSVGHCLSGNTHRVEILLSDTSVANWELPVRLHHAIVSNQQNMVSVGFSAAGNGVDDLGDFHNNSTSSVGYSAFFVKKVDSLDIPPTFAFLSFSTPCDPLPSFLRFLLPSETVAGPPFDLLATTLSTKHCSFASAFTCAPSFPKLCRRFSIKHHSEKSYRGTYSYDASSSTWISWARYCPSNSQASFVLPTVHPRNRPNAIYTQSPLTLKQVFVFIFHECILGETPHQAF